MTGRIDDRSQQFVPVDIVRGLVESGRPLAPGVEQRFMTVMFSDIAGFTSIAEQLTPQELSDQASRYFSIVTSAVADLIPHLFLMYACTKIYTQDVSHALRDRVSQYSGITVMALKVTALPAVSRVSATAATTPS